MVANSLPGLGAHMRGILSLTFFLSLFLGATVPAATINVSITGAKTDDGHILVSLFDRAEFFPDKPEQALLKEKVTIKNGRAKIAFKDLKAGDYAIAIAHDANDNGKLDTNGLGIPTEGFGFSRNPKIVAGPPKFETSSVHLEEKNVSTEIKLKYY